MKETLHLIADGKSEFFHKTQKKIKKDSICKKYLTILNEINVEMDKIRIVLFFNMKERLLEK